MTSWLGPADDDSDIAIRWVQEYGQQAYELGIGTTYKLQLRQLLKMRSSRDLDQSHSVENALGTFIDNLTTELLAPSTARQKATIMALTSLLNRPYWSRIWVVQEIVSA